MVAPFGYLSRPMARYGPPASLRGKPVLLDFWATWCEPCREAMPHIQALYDQFKAKGLMVVGIDTDEPAETARKYFEDQHYSFHHGWGSGMDLSAEVKKLVE